ncbi:MAG: tRNA (guanosine(46)-N7)-methyltransferase TrmB [Planctomycetaceae bacterium]
MPEAERGTFPRSKPLFELFDFESPDMSLTEPSPQPEHLRREPPRDLYPWFLTIQDVDRDYSGRLDWREFFGNDQPVQLDIGSGRGLFLFNAAMTHPEQNFLGIEIDYKEGRRAAQRLKKRGLTTARVLGGDVKIPLTRMIAPHSVAAVHVYFPDPWWKQKHRKRRVFNAEFVDLAAQILMPGGLLHSWTDVAEYFGVISELMNNHPQFHTLAAPEERAPEHDMDYQTSFERKGRKAGTAIHRGLWQRKALTHDADHMP